MYPVPGYPNERRKNSIGCYHRRSGEPRTACCREVRSRVNTVPFCASPAASVTTSTTPKRGGLASVRQRSPNQAKQQRTHLRAYSRQQFYCELSVRKLRQIRGKFGATAKHGFSPPAGQLFEAARLDRTCRHISTTAPKRLPQNGQPQQRASHRKKGRRQQAAGQGHEPKTVKLDTRGKRHAIFRARSLRNLTKGPGRYQ